MITIADVVIMSPSLRVPLEYFYILSVSLLLSLLSLLPLLLLSFLFLSAFLSHYLSLYLIRRCAIVYGLPGTYQCMVTAKSASGAASSFIVMVQVAAAPVVASISGGYYRSAAVDQVCDVLITRSANRLFVI